MADIFVMNSNRNTGNVSANTRKRPIFYNPINPKTTNYGLQTLRCLGQKNWETLPPEIQMPASLSIFKNSIKNCKGIQCPCRICAEFTPNLGFL